MRSNKGNTFNINLSVIVRLMVAPAPPTIGLRQFSALWSPAESALKIQRVGNCAAQVLGK